MRKDRQRPSSWLRTSDRSWDIDDRYGRDNVQVSEPEAHYTGLLDADGKRLYRKSSPAGFIRFKDRR